MMEKKRRKEMETDEERTKSRREDKNIGCWVGR
jgi:hypothetical protein